MDLDEYRARHPDSYAIGVIDSMLRYPSVRHVRLCGVGLVQFTDDTAYRWAGPHPENCAIWTLRDHTHERDWQTRQTLQEKWDALSIRSAAYRMRNGEPTKSDWRTPGKVPVWLRYWRSWLGGTSGEATPSEPFTLRLSGNDDTSYTKCYASEHEAREELDMMLACEPLDFHRDFMALGGWCFTN